MKFICGCWNFIPFRISDDINERVLFDGTVCYRPRTYSDGLMFQLQILISSKQGPRPAVLGAGGWCN